MNSVTAIRWSTSLRSYVDSEWRPCTTNYEPKPPSDGSAPFLQLPMELRLQIYGYLTCQDTFHPDEFHRTFDVPISGSARYAYLYRSPGRFTKPNAISKQVVRLFHICRQMRNELVDACFNDRVFVLEASLYQRDTGGLDVLPRSLGPASWVRRLLLLTVIEMGGTIKGIGDLRAIQMMTNLTELRIVFSARKSNYGSYVPGILDRQDNVLKAVLDCVPKEAVVHFEMDETFRTELLRQLGRCTQYLFNNMEDTEYALASVMDNIGALSVTQGRLSGSVVNHAMCQYPTCQEGLECVNSLIPLLLHSSWLTEKPLLDVDSI